MVLTKEELRDLLVRRDGISKGDADDLIEEVQNEVWCILDDELLNEWEALDMAEAVVSSELGLEPDYLSLFF